MIQITERSARTFIEVVQALAQNAHQTGVRELPILDGPNGARVATLTLHDLPTRPKDMPRAMRPKRKLSKRQRDAAKREKVLHRNRVTA